MPYFLGASFSNVQQSFDLPTYFVAFAIETTRKSELQGIKTKDEIQKDPEFNRNLFDLSMVQNEINRFAKMAVKSDVIKFAKADRKGFDSDLSFILFGFLKAIESVRFSRLQIASEGFERCFLHIPVNPEGKELTAENLDYFNNPISEYKIRFQKRGDFDPILEFARLGAWFEYLDMMRRKPAFINKQIRENQNLQFFQFVRLIWNSPPVEFYPDSFVGYPRMVLKTQNDTKDLVIQPGTQLDLFPISSACLGLENALGIPECKRTSERSPFGSLLVRKGFEKCGFCRQDAQGELCLYQKPRCDGNEIQCHDEAFAAQFCQAEFCVYLTLYDEKMKVGRAMKSRIVGRLIEQCAFDGLVFYPIPGLPLADRLEERLSSQLRERANHLGIDELSAVSERITYRERLRHLTSLDWSENVQAKRDRIYDTVVEILKSLDSPEATYLLALERRKLHLSRNWIGDRKVKLGEDDAVRDIRFRRIKGKVTGVVGSFILAGGKVYDTSGMEGYVTVVSSS